MKEVRPREIRRYKTQDGRRPFSEWFNSLKDESVQERIEARLYQLQLGNFGDCEYLGEGVYELRIHYKAGYRVYFGNQDGVVVILLCGGGKKTQKRDAKKAKAYWKDSKKRRRRL